MKASGDFMEIYETQMRKLKSRGEELTVGDIVNHPKLFAAYPKLANIEVKIMPYDAHGKGRVAMNKDGTLSHIEINDNLDGKETLSTLLHEMQHVTQDVEGFARGGSAKQLSEKYFSENYQHQLADLKKEAEAAMQSGNREKTDAVYKKIVDLYSPASFDAYKRLAGEVEARNVQIRQALTEAQRKMLSPESTQDTIGKDQIVVWNGKQMESRTEATKEASEKRIKDLFAGAKPEPVHGVKILDKSDIFDMLGLSKRNVLIAEAHGLVQGRISHSAFTETDWNKVPEWIDNPIAVFKQEDKAYRFIGPELLNGHPVVMAVKPNEKSQLGAGIQIDILKTAFAKDDPKKRMPMQQWVDHGDLVYANLSKTAQFKADTGYSLPVRLNDLKVIKQKVAFKNKELAKQKRTLLENPDVKTESNLATYKAEEEKKNPVAGDTADTIHSASSTEQQDSNKGKSLAAVEAVDTIHSTSATEQQSSKSDTIQQKGSDVKFSKPSVSEEDAYQAEKAKIADYVDANFTKIVNKMKAEKFISVKC